jgi:hypothetical protein
VCLYIVEILITIKLKQKMTKITPKIIKSIYFSLLSGMATLASAQATTTPGTPTTGLGGMLGTNMIMLVFALSLIVMGSIIAYRTNKAS